jgi:hypothetical protein
VQAAEALVQLVVMQIVMLLQLQQYSEQVLVVMVLRQKFQVVR